MENMKTIWNWLHTVAGFGDNATAAIMGNMKAESDYRPDNVENRCPTSDSEYTRRIDCETDSNYFAFDGYGYGLCQWTYPARKKNLFEFADKSETSISDLEMQLAFMLYELKNDFPSLYTKLCKGESISKLCADFCTVFENPADKSPAQLDKRYNYALDALNTCTNEETDPFKNAIEIVVDGVKYKAVKV